jgi:hypothetical protein
MEFILTLAAISPLFYARGKASLKHGGGVITSSLTNAMLVFCCKMFLRAKEKNEKNYDEKKRKVRKKRKNKEKNKERKKERK